MLTKLDIINAALVSLGASPVQDLNETVHAKAAASFWNLALSAVLRAHPWNFAMARRSLAASADAPVFGYAKTFPLPADWIRTVEVTAEDFKQESGRILCNQDSLNIRYIAMVADPSRFDALFSDALSAYLAAKLAYPLTSSSSQQDVCWSAYKELLRLARSVDSLEDPPDDLPESSLLTARG
ncbi:hypothetical protein F6V25_07980 [Oryzomonas japonica]|uniref:Uncharacterized protein n=1 Tax=Oryzomonas japonica TaxID=2603858 RepID=A0A7J4ZR66_9BACT|nr:hypothetical protein [Oryzomonas japonica]KAB0665651.1 hypothetical protein F6V25_07980 [Oryzomonas japonica]